MGTTNQIRRLGDLFAAATTATEAAKTATRTGDHIAAAIHTDTARAAAADARTLARALVLTGETIHIDGEDVTVIDVTTSTSTVTYTVVPGANVDITDPRTRPARTVNIPWAGITGILPARAAA